MVGVGKRGSSDLKTLLDLAGVEAPAICDINEANLRRAQDMVEKSGRKEPEGYSRGLEDFRRMVTRDDLDAVVTATPWEWHTPVCVAAIKAGKYAATEVPAAITLEEFRDLVNTSEQTGKPCMILENVCFYRNVLMILNLSSASRGINALAVKRWGPDSPAAKRQYAMGDSQHFSVPDEERRHHRVEPRRASAAGLRPRVPRPRRQRHLFQHAGKDLHRGQDAQPAGAMAGSRSLLRKIRTPGLEEVGPDGEQIFAPGRRLHRSGLFVAAVGDGSQTPIDVYDTVTWSAITALSEQSVASKSMPVEFPDFTRGKWRTAKPVQLKEV
jgi:hypothetical protein